MTTKKAIARLKAINNKMIELLEEAEDLVETHAKSNVYNTAKAYWIPHIAMALSDNHDYLGSDDTMSKTIKDMEHEVSKIV
jgi:hypothetical protein